jgi:hypothetical protein
MQYSITQDYIWKEVGEKIVVLNLDSGRYFSLNGTGSVIWTALMEKARLDEIVDRICATFEIDAENARNDAEQMIDEFVRNGLIAAD